MKDFIKRTLKWLRKKDMEITRRAFLVVQPPTDEDNSVILLHGIDFREEKLR